MEKLKKEFKPEEKFIRLAKIFLILEEDEKNGEASPNRSASLRKQKNSRISNSNC